MISVRLFDVQDLLVMNIQPEQVEARLARLALRDRGDALSASGRSFTIMRRDGGAVLFCGGALQSHADLATIWAIFASEAIADRRIMVHVRNRARDFLAKLTHRRVDALVRSDHRGAHSFAHALGFAAEARLNDYFEDGGDAVVYRYRRPK